MDLPETLPVVQDMEFLAVLDLEVLGVVLDMEVLEVLEETTAAAVACLTIILTSAVMEDREQFVSFGPEIHVNSHQHVLVLRDCLTTTNLSQDLRYGKYIL